jgi:hypothetical protein
MNPKTFLKYLLPFYDTILVISIDGKIDVIRKNKSQEHLFFKPLHPNIITFLTRYLNTTKVSEYRNSAAKTDKR